MKGFRQRVVSRPVTCYCTLRKRGADLMLRKAANYYSMNSSRERKNPASPHPRRKTQEPPTLAPPRLLKAPPPSLQRIQLTEHPPRPRRNSSTRGTNHYPATITYPMLHILANYNPGNQVFQARSVPDRHSRSISNLSQESARALASIMP
jgi:hypothetical protein